MKYFILSKHFSIGLLYLERFSLKKNMKKIAFLFNKSIKCSYYSISIHKLFWMNLQKVNFTKMLNFMNL